MTQHPRTERALKAISLLKKQGVFVTQKELCKIIDYDYSNYSQIKKGNRDLPEKNIDNLIKAYGINPDYIKFGRNPIFLDLPANKENKQEAISDPLKTASGDENQMFFLKHKLEIAKMEIRMLERQLEEKNELINRILPQNTGQIKEKAKVKVKNRSRFDS